MALSVEYVQDVLKGHSDRNAMDDRYELYRRSYVGGAEYASGNYLIRHSQEGKRDYARRVKEAVYTNYSAPIVDVLSAYLFREKPQRAFGAGADTNKAMEAFSDNADMRGRSLPVVMRETSKWASVFGFMGVIVDKPLAPDAVNRAQELELGVRPYITQYSPQHIVNWKFETNYVGPALLSELVLREKELDESVEVFRIWRRDSWELWSVAGVNGREQPPEFLEEGINPLGIIPFALIPNKDSFDEMSGISDLADIADINKHIYRLDSAALEIIERTAFPFLEVPIDAMSGRSNDDVIAGTGNVLERDITDGIGHRWVEPGHASLQRILDWRGQAVLDIRAVAKMGEGSATQRQGSAAFSGQALEIKFQQLNAILADKATTMEHAETAIMRLALLWENLDTTQVAVRYPRKFGIRDVVADLDTAMRAKEIIISPVYDKMVQRSLASRSLSDLGYSRDEIDIAEADIEKQPYVPPASKLTAVGGMNGVSVVETTAAGQIARNKSIEDGASANAGSPAASSGVRP